MAAINQHSRPSSVCVCVRVCDRARVVSERLAEEGKQAETRRGRAPSAFCLSSCVNWLFVMSQKALITLSFSGRSQTSAQC